MLPKVTVGGAAVVETVPNPPKEAGALVLWVVGAVCPNAIPAAPEENCSVLPEVEEDREPPNAVLLLLDTGAGAEGKSEEVVELLPNTEAVETVEAVDEPPGAASNKGLKVGGALVSAAVEDTLKMGLNPEDSRDELVLEEDEGTLEEGALVRGRLKRLGAGAGVEVVVVSGGASAEVEAGGAEVGRVRLGWAGAEEAGAVAGAGEGLFLFRTSSSREVCGAVLRLRG